MLCQKNYNLLFLLSVFIYNTGQIWLDMTNTDESVRYNKGLAHLGKTHLEFSVGGGTVG